MNRPNILFVFSDQQRWDTVDAYGSPIFPGLTPHLDSLAADGVRFENAFTCQPVCGPARAALQTGLYPTQLGCFTNARGLPTGQRTIAHDLRDAGYTAGYIGKWHLAQETPDAKSYAFAPIPEPRRGGYQYWLAADVLEFSSHGYEGVLWDTDNRRVDFEGYRADALTDFALDYLDRYAGGARSEPFFLFLSYIEPHHQNDLNRFVGPLGSKRRFADFRVPGDLKSNGGDWREQLPDYLGCCSSLDRNLGRLRARLQANGLAENTLVVYASDHGCHFRTRNNEYKRACHDGCIRIPLIAAGPGFRGGTVVKDLVSLIDLPPTVLTAAGIAPPPAMRGKALQPLLAGDSAGWPAEVFLQLSEAQVGRAIRTAKWKYSVAAPDKVGWRDAGSDRYVEDCLYDLAQDPYEQDNRVTDPACTGIRAQLARTLQQRMLQAGEEAPLICPPGHAAAGIRLSPAE